MISPYLLRPLRSLKEAFGILQEDPGRRDESPGPTAVPPSAGGQWALGAAELHEAAKRARSAPGRASGAGILTEERPRPSGRSAAEG